jgi:hypothetical protein
MYLLLYFSELSSDVIIVNILMASIPSIFSKYIFIFQNTTILFLLLDIGLFFFKLCAHLLIGLFGVLVFNVLSCSYILDINSLPVE